MIAPGDRTGLPFWAASSTSSWALAAHDPLARHPCNGYDPAVIVSFGDAATEALYHGSADRRTRRFPRDIVKACLRKLDMLAAAVTLDDLRAPPGNRLEAL